MASFRIRLPDPGSGPSDARSVAGSESSRTSAASSGVSSVGDGGVADLVRRLVRKVTANVRLLPVASIFVSPWV